MPVNTQYLGLLSGAKVQTKLAVQMIGQEQTRDSKFALWQSGISPSWDPTGAKYTYHGNWQKRLGISMHGCIGNSRTFQLDCYFA